jgi:pSer/pThr/pTyr-binding forkhead associated (FHA) protein
MEVKLVVANGKNIGQEIPVTGPKFLVGRADDCQLRPRSDVISRYHCVILVEEAFLVVRDFGSKNGTFVNGEQIMGEQELKNGDRLRVGQLEFEVEVSVEGEGERTAEVEGVDDGAVPAGEGGTPGQLDLSDWLGQEDSSGTVLGMLPLRRATSLDQEAPPGTTEDPKAVDKDTDPPKK